jgi:hypothetical protein
MGRVMKQLNSQVSYDISKSKDDNLCWLDDPIATTRSGINKDQLDNII